MQVAQLLAVIVIVALQGLGNGRHSNHRPLPRRSACRDDVCELIHDEPLEAEVMNQTGEEEDYESWSADESRETAMRLKRTLLDSISGSFSWQQSVGGGGAHVGRALSDAPTVSNNSSEEAIRILPQGGELCADLNWVDRDGDTCARYVEAGWCQASWQPAYANANGIIADVACCGCGGGGHVYCQDMDWVGRGDFGCDAYVDGGFCLAAWQPDWADENGVIADQACCDCGGGECRDHNVWASSCPLWRSSGWCANNTYGPAWNFTANGTFEQHVIDGVPVSEGCCGCGRRHQLPPQTLEDYLREHQGVTAERVREILLDSSAGLIGSIPSAIAEFTNLEVLDLQGNAHLGGEIPAAVSNLSKLRLLDLSRTGVGGELPSWLGDHLPQLEHLFLASAGFSGPLPPLGNFSQLISLDLGSSAITGSLPEGIAALTELEMLSLGVNQLRGSLPDALGSLSKLTYCSVRDNGLAGSLPDSIGSWTSLEEMYAHRAGLQGTLPNAIGSFSNATQFYVYGNSLTGSLPNSIANLVKLRNMNLYQNSLRGTVPDAISGLTSVSYLHLGRNSFSGTLPNSIGMLKALVSMYIYYNDFTGTLPIQIGKMTALKTLSMSYCCSLTDAALPDAMGELQQLHTVYMHDIGLAGPLPDAIFNLTALRNLGFRGNSLSGSIPHSIHQLTALQRLDAMENDLTGSLPSAISALQSLTYMHFAFNSLRGTMPDGIGNLTNLNRLYIYGGNSLTGTLPAGFYRLSALEEVLLYDNSLSGTISPAVSQLTGLIYTLGLSGNNWSGELPKEIFALTGLTNFLIRDNIFLEGSIPTAIGSMTRLGRLDVSNTSIGGSLPDEIGAACTSMYQLDVYYTRMRGTIPAALGSCTNLRYFFLFGSDFSGTLPPQLSQLSLLQDFVASSNRFAGTLPKEYGRLTNLKTYSVYNNNFSGEVDADAIPRVSLTGLNLRNNSGLTGALPDLATASLLEIIEVPNCSFTAAGSMPVSLKYVNMNGNRLRQVPEGLHVLPNLEELYLQGNMISSWPPKGAYPLAPLLAELCGTTLLEAKFEWTNLKVIDVSHNPLDVHIHIFLQTLYWSRALTEVKAVGCGLHGDIANFLYRTSWGDGNCIGVTVMDDGLPSLVRLDVSANSITQIIQGPHDLRVLSRARFDNNNLTYLNRAWFNEGVDAESQVRRFPLSSLNITGNQDLRFDVLPPFAECGPDTMVSSLAADPRSFTQATGTDTASLSYECGSPCPPSGMSLATDIGLPDEGNLCRCMEGYGLLRDQCWDAHWRDADGLSCRQHVERGCSNPEAASVCCGCGGAGGGGNGKNCSRCPANTYSYSGLDIYRHRSQCVACPVGAATARAEDGGGGSSICDCECPIGTFLEDGESCRDSALVRLQANRSFTGRETCKPCHFLKTTLRNGSRSERECVCDILNVNNLVDASPLCGCKAGHFLNSKLRHCEPCASEGEECEWTLDDVDASIRPPVLKRGFWTPSAWQIGLNESTTFEGHSIYKCFSEETCVDDRGSCARGRIGRACGLCARGWYGGPDGPCLKCRGSALVGLVLVLMSIPFDVIFAHIVLSGAGSEKKGMVQTLRSFRVSLKQCVTHLQAVSIVGSFSIEWPVDAQNLFDFVSKYTFRFTDAFGIGCLGEEHSASVELWFRYSFPVAFILAGIFLTPLVSGFVACLLRVGTPKGRKLFEKGKERMRMSVMDSFNAVFWCLTLFFAVFLKWGLSLFTCTMNPNGERTVRDFPHLHCAFGKSGADEEWLGLATPAAVYTFLCLSCIYVLYYRAYRRTWQCMERSNLKDRGSESFLFEDFRSACIHWPLILLTRQAVLNLIGAVLSGFGPWQLLSAAILNLVIAVKCWSDKPYTDNSNTVLETLNAVSLVLVCTFTAGMGFGTEPGLEDIQSLTSGSAADAALAVRAQVLWVFQLVSVVGPMTIIAYQLFLLVPGAERCLPSAIRPLKAEEEEIVREFLKEVEDDQIWHKVLDKMDVQELITTSRCLNTTPAAVGVMRRPGQRSLGVRELAKARVKAKHGANQMTATFSGSDTHTNSVSVVTDSVLPDAAKIAMDRDFAEPVLDRFGEPVLMQV